MAVKGATTTRSTGKARTRAERAAKTAASKNGSKASTTKAATAKAKTGGAKREDARKRDAELTAKVLEMRSGDKPKSWGEIAKKLSITPGKAAFLVMISEVKPKQKLKGTDEEIAKAAIELRLGEGLGWGQIAARTYDAGIPEPRIKALAFEHATAAQRKELKKNVASKRAAAKPKASRGR